MKPVARVITASAGSGKTYRLSLEYISLALQIGRLTGYEDPAACADILVITFTRKATAEIRQRIIEHLHTLLRGDLDSQALADKIAELGAGRIAESDMAWLERVLHGLLRSGQNFRVSTIDSFIGAQFAEIIAPWLGLLDWELETETPDEVYRDVLRTLLLSAPLREKMRRLFENYVRHGRQVGKYLALVKTVTQLRWMFRLMREEHRVALPGDETHWLARYRKGLLGILREAAAQGSPLGVVSKASKVEMSDMRERITAHWRDNGDETALSAALSDDLLRQYRNKLDGLVIGKAKEAYLADVLPNLHISAAAAVSDETPMLLEVAEAILDAYDAVRMQSGRLSHTDVTQYTWESLHQHPHSLAPMFYENITRRTRFLLIDEFQDTSVDQFQVLRPIIEEIVAGGGQKEWGGFVIVGDEKQSIYGWRGGESELLPNLPVIFRKALPHLVPESLPDNWRSAETVNNFVNMLFGDNGLSSKLAAQGVRWACEPSIAMRRGPGYVEWRLADHSEDKIDGPATFVREMVLPAWRRGDLAGESAILARTNSHLAAIAAELTAAGVPFTHYERKTLDEHRLVRPLLHLLRWCARRDIFDLHVFLRSDWVGLCSADFKSLLLAVRDRAADLDPRDEAIIQRVSDNPAMRELGETITGWLNETRPSLLLERVASEMGVQSVCRYEDDQRAVEAFLCAARRYENESDAVSVYGFLEWVDEQAKQGDLPLPSKQAAQGPLLMTIHQSKGLGFDHVLVYMKYGQSGGRPNNLELHLHKQFDESYEHLREWLLYTQLHHAALGKLLDSGMDHLKGLRELMRYESSRELISEINNFYVALTRAKDSLYIFNYVPAKQDTWSKYTLQKDGFKAVIPWQVDILGSRDNLWRNGAVEPHPPESEPKPAAPTTDWSRLLQAGEWTLDDSPDEDSLRRMRVSFQRQAATVGELVHDWLAQVRRGDDVEMRRADAVVTAKWGARFSEKRLRALLTWLRGKAGEMGVFADRWTRVLCEYPVFDADGNPYRIDRILVDEAAGEVKVLDFKTGDAGDRWQEQLYPALVRAMPWLKPDWRVGFRYVFLNVNEVSELSDK